MNEREAVDRGHADVIQTLYGGLWNGYIQAAGDPKKETAAITRFKEGLSLARRCYAAASKALSP